MFVRLMSQSNKPLGHSKPTNSHRHAEHVPKALAGLAALSTAAYFEGVLYIKAYYAKFGASWILDEVPMAIFFERSMIPFLLLFFLAFLAVMGLFDIETKEQAAASSRFKASIAVITYGPWGVFVLGTADFLVGELGFLKTAIVLSVTSVLLLLFLLASLFKVVLVWFRNRDIPFDRSRLSLAVAVIALGLYWVPSQLGSNFGTLDKDPASSTLSSINLRDNIVEYKLLLSYGDRLYLFPTSYGGEFPQIEKAPSSQVEFIGQRDTSDPS